MNESSVKSGAQTILISSLCQCTCECSDFDCVYKPNLTAGRVDAPVYNLIGENLLTRDFPTFKHTVILIISFA